MKYYTTIVFNLYYTTQITFTSSKSQYEQHWPRPES